MRKILEEKLWNCQIEHGRILEIEWKDEIDPQALGLRFVKAENICRVSVKLEPAPDSEIMVEVWLPSPEMWNGNFLGTGNGGFAGTINSIALLNGASRGYATANTDMGTTPDPDDCIGRPEKWIDFGYRATHLMTVVGKQLTECVYGRKPEYAYFQGGSTGGQQALSEAQRYPGDYDGIVCYAPAHNRVKLHSFFIWNWQALHGKQGACFLAKEASALRNEIVRRYGKIAGNAPGDGFLNYPGNVKVDVEAIRRETRLLTKEQSEALIKLYAGPSDPVTGQQIMPGFVPGTEGEGLSLVDISDRDKFAHDFFYLFRWIWGKEFDFMKFDFHKDLQEAMEKLSPVLDAVDPFLTAFRKRGGKLLIISGLCDAIIPYTGAVEYYRQICEMQGGLEETMTFCRHFLVPGLAHTFGGPGVQEIGNMGLKSVPRDREHDTLCAMESWVEKGSAPDRLLGTALANNSLLGAFDHDRPAFAYPYVPMYRDGDPKDPGSFQAVQIEKQA